MADKYILRVTAGPSYDPATHMEVQVNAADPLRIHHELMEIELSVRIQGYEGLPRGSPITSPYFSTEPHASNDDRYSICFRFTPKEPAGIEETLSSASSPSRRNSNRTSSNPTAQRDDEENEEEARRGEEEEEEEEEETSKPRGIPATDLQFGNDFAYPIRDRLPTGFSYALGIVKWWIDPGLEGDPYADRPYMYGAALSSLNVVHVGQGEHDEAKGGLFVQEGGNAEGMEWRSKICAPETPYERMRWALHEQNKRAWVWEWGRTYAADFFNSYLDFTHFVLRLPAYNMQLIDFVDNGYVPHPGRITSSKGPKPKPKPKKLDEDACGAEYGVCKCL